MENNTKKLKKKKSRKPLYILAVFFVVFGFFIYLISRPSPEDNAKKELALAYTKENVKEVWEKYKLQLHDNESFLLATRTKLNTLSLTDEEIKDCIKWLPPAPTSLNIIVVPDLSKRIIDDINNPKQIESDVTILKNIWQTFYDETKLKKNSKDKLIIDVTDEGQANGEFRNFADSLIFDLANSKNGQINRLYLEKKAKTYQIFTNKLYASARTTPLGANYWDYFETSLSRHIRKPDIFSNYNNILILITDGYLEPQNKEKTGRTDYTGNYKSRELICEYEGRNSKNYGKYIRPIDDCSLHFPSLKVLVVEVNNRKKGSTVEKNDPGTPCDYPILKHQWQNWFELLEIKNSDSEFFIRRSQDTRSTKETIKKFITS